MDYFIVFISIGILFLIYVSIILRLIYQMSDMKYELKIAKINCQKDLDRIEDRINQLTNRDTDTYKREIQKLEKLHKSLSDLIDSKEKEIKSIKQILND
jgi:peptidoglycan hydrolase CwlO-like protein